MTRSRWIRTAPLSEPDRGSVVEKWSYYRDGRPATHFDVQVDVGKPLDVGALKGSDVHHTRAYAQFLASTAERLYRGSSPLTSLARCTICEESLENAPTELCVYGVRYIRCPSCRHVLVRDRPAVGVFDQVFAESERHSSMYVDTATIAVRMAQVVAPKLDWTLVQYERYCGATPGRLVDVGAGGGHFLAGAAERGLAVEGFETSRVSRQFARDAFGVRLRDDDFLGADVAAADIITMWGLLEYVAEPRAFLRGARALMSARGMLVVEVPRVDALGTRVQAERSAVVARHMDPTCHINAFSDASLCTALVEEGFAPVAAWYFGMDAWEMLTQARFLIDDESVATKLAPLLPAVQAAADRGRQCDDIIVAAVPS